MQQGLFRVLRDHFSGLDSRVFLCFIQILDAMIKLRTVNLAELCIVAGNKGSHKSSNYRRLQRFFSKAKIDAILVAKLIMNMFGGKRVVLCLDRTNWMFGKANINILVLAIAYKGIAVPILWSFIGHKGNSNYKQRIHLIQRFINLFGKECIETLLGDREFVGDEWLKWLDHRCIGFVIRVRDNMKIGRTKGELTTANNLLHALNPNETISLQGKRRITNTSGAIKLYIAACRNKDGVLVIVVTNQSPETALEQYKVRWEIENLFGCLKTRGFNFESTHITDEHKINRMMCLLTIVFAYAYKIGEWKNEIIPIKLKSHMRKSVSMFRYGLDVIRTCLLTPSTHCSIMDLLNEKTCKKYFQARLK